MFASFQSSYARLCLLGLCGLSFDSLLSHNLHKGKALAQKVLYQLSGSSLPTALRLFAYVTIAYIYLGSFVYIYE